MNIENTYAKILGIDLQIGEQYVKDFSFENPRYTSPSTIISQPKFEISLDVVANMLDESGKFEVVIGVAVKAFTEDRTLFVSELKYAGLATFKLSNMPDMERDLMIFVRCPSILFPYARRIISDATRDGGYPPLLLSPVDFLALYIQRKEDELASHAIN